MSEHFPDATKKVDFIRRDKVHVQIERALCEGLSYHRTIDEILAADVVARDCYDRILAENDTMREMLAEVGKKVGDTMDDVRQVVHGRWEIASDPRFRHCSVCHDKVVFNMKNYPNFCDVCGADMRPVKTGQIGEKDSG